MSVQAIKLRTSNQWYWAHSSKSKTFLPQGASWRYPPIDPLCPHMISQCLHGPHDLLWNDGGSQYAWFLNVAPGCRQSWWHFRCHIEEALCRNRLRIPLKFASSTELSTTTCGGNILGFGGGERYTILLLRRPTHQGPPNKLTSAGGWLPIIMTPAQSESVNPHNEKCASLGYQNT